MTSQQKEKDYEDFSTPGKYISYSNTRVMEQAKIEYEILKKEHPEYSDEMLRSISLSQAGAHGVLALSLREEWK